MFNRFTASWCRTLAIQLLLAVSTAHAQPAPRAPVPPGPPAAPSGAAYGSTLQPARPPGPPPHALLAPLAEPARIKGTVSRWLTNPDGELDGMLLADSTQVIRSCSSA